MRLPTVIAAVILGILSVFTGNLGGNGASAHRAPLMITTVEYIAADKMLEVIHKVHAHDVQKALLKSDQASTGVFVMDVEAQARFALYTAENFHVWGANGTPLPLNTIGAEVEGDYLFVYQEAPMNAAPSRIAVDSTILRDIFPNYGNHVNIRVGTNVRTLIFTDDDGPKSATF